MYTPNIKNNPTIILIHGAFADGSCWRHIIPLLKRDGYTSIAVQNQLASLPEDIATTKRLIDAQNGPVIAVAHSYGGAVLTGSAADNPQVKALVYLSGFAPDAGEKIVDLLGKFKPSLLNEALIPDAAGFLYIDRTKFHEVFAKDVSENEAYVLAATQKPISGAIFEQSLDKAAWKSIPSWYLVAQDDQTINPDLLRFMAKRIGAKTIEVKASHVSFISHPEEVVKLIEEAAKSTVK